MQRLGFSSGKKLIQVSPFVPRAEVMGGGSEVLVIQDVTGTLSPGAHAGSYNGQDAYNGMLIVDELRNAEDRGIQTERTGQQLEGAGLERRNRFGSGGGVHR